MRRMTGWLCGVVLCGTMGCLSTAETAEQKKPQPVRALLVTGGCCHDYAYQSRQLVEFSTEKAGVIWTVVNDGGTGTEAQIPLYAKADWAKGYDVVVHNECFANTTDEAYIRRITETHKAGVPAVVIHCAMHTYRAATIDDWRAFLGVTSKRHDHQSNYAVTATKADHPALKGFPEKGWTTPKDELYVIEKLWPTAQALAVSKSEKDGATHPVIWVNQYGKARVFGTTYGHSNETFADPVFLNTVTQGLLWAAGRS